MIMYVTEATAKTSLTHPLQIASVELAKGMGRIGITFCPGKVQNSAFSGRWARDLATDMDAIRDWGAVAVVTLVEEQELAALQVEGIKDAVETRHMTWYHLPITDVSVPDQRFHSAWAEVGAALRRRLRNGFDILVHCKGGLGRAGVRLQNIWLRSRRRLAECGPRLVVDVRRQACGVASADIRWSVV